MQSLKFRLRRLFRSFNDNQDGKGLTLVELMIVAMVLSLTIGTLLVVFVSALNHIVLAKEISIATDDLRDVLERIKATPFANLTTQFPSGSYVNASLIGGFALLSEAIVIIYPQGTGVDPLEIKVEASWTSKDKRTRTLSFKTLRTRML